MTLGGSFLQSKVGRRVLALFLLSALIPLVFFSVFAYRQVTQLLTDQAQRELTLFSASYGAAAYERLLLAERTLDNVVAELSRDEASQRLEGLSKPVFRGLVRVARSGERRVLYGGDFVAGDLGVAELADLHRGKPLLLKTPPLASGVRGVGIARLIDSVQADGNWVEAEIDPGFLWGDADRLPYLTQICVQDAQGVLLYCSSDELKLALRDKPVESRRAAGQGVRAKTVGSATHLVASREVFVASRFANQYWVVSASRPQAEVLAPVSRFQWIFWGSVILAALVVALLSVSQIRRTLGPLESLMAATRRIARRDFSMPVVVQRSDEFGQLAQTFNNMSTRLDRQFNVLGALSRIDHSILSDLNVARVIDEVLSSLREMLKPDIAAMFVLKHDSETEGERYGLATTPGASPMTWTPAARQWLLDQPSGRRMAGEDVQVLRQHFALAPDAAQDFFMLPVMWQERLCGALLLGWREPASLEAEDMAHVRDFADRVGVVLFSSAREATLYYRARYDVLTDLPNRYLFTERLTQEMARAAREGGRLAVLFVALDRFKNVSDVLGHAAGDQLIRDAAARLRQQVRASDTLCRFGAQEFAVILSGDIDSEKTDVVAQHLLQKMAQPFVIDQVESFITASIGIALYPGDGDSAADLLRNADTACARTGGQGAYAYFTENMNQRAVERAALERELRRAVEQRQFLLYYQPKIDFGSGRICGAEALIRWNHPQRGVVAPGVFIELAEDTGLIVEMGRFALAEGCRQFAQWRDHGVHLEHIAVNVSSRQFRSSSLLSDVREHVTLNDLKPGELELEVTESVMVDNFDEVSQALLGLRQCGAHIALDDFGTGYSSMRYLEKLPIDTLKIDMSFVRPIRENGEGGAIAAAIIALARSLKKLVVAEGVETEAQADYLKRLGCHLVQGYLYGKPLPAAEFAALYERWTPLP